MSQKDEEYAKELLSEFNRAQRTISQIKGVKANGAEARYSQLYDKLAMRGVGKRRRLRMKYRP